MSKRTNLSQPDPATVLANSFAGIMTFDEHYTITSWNKSLENWFDVPSKEACGSDIFEILSSIDSSELEFLLHCSLTDQEAASQILSLTHDAGSTFHVQSAPLFADDGQQIGGQIIFLPAQGAKQTTVEPTKVSSLSKPDIDQFTEGIFVIDQNGYFIRANDAGLKTLGYTKQELFTLRFHDLLDQSDDQELLVGEDQEYKYPPQQKVFQVYSKEGTVLSLETNASKLEGGCVQLVARDITYSKHSEWQLRHSEEQFRLLFEHSPMPILIYDTNTLQILEVNQAAVDLYQYSYDEFKTITIKSLRPEQEVEKLDRFMKMLDDDAIKLGQWIHAKKDGTKLQVDVTSYAISLNAKKVRISIINDNTEQIEVEKNLANSEKKFQVLTEESIVGVYMFSKEAYDYVNPKLAEIYGYEPEEIIGKFGPEDFVHPDDWPYVKQTIAERFRGDTSSVHFETRIINRSREVRNIEVFGSSIRFGDELSIIGTVVDITKRKEAEEALVYNKKLLQNIFNVSQDALFLLSPETIAIEDCNPMALQMFGLADKKELIGQPVSFLRVHKITNEEVASAEQYLQNGKQWVKEFLYETKKGKQFWGELILKRFSINDRVFDLARISDINERKLADQELREKQKFIEALTTNSPNIIHVFDVDLDEFVYANRNIAEFLGYELEELEQFQNGLSELIAQEDIPVLKTRFREIHNLKAGQIHTTEFRMKHKKGYWIWFLAYDTVFKRDKEGNVKQILGTLQNITDRKNAEQKLENFNEELENEVRERTKELETANQELEAFNYTVSHDLRNPLRAIEIFSSFLEKKYAPSLDEKGKDYIEQIRKSVRNITQLLDDLLAFSRIGRKEMSSEKVSMNEIFQEVIDELQYFSQEKGQPQIILHELHGTIADRNMLRHVVLNLVSNAFKFTKFREQPRIEIGSYEDEQNGIVYYVKDNGIGFDMQYARKIFGVFERLHTETEYEGTGGGLSIVERVMRRHNGTVWAESKEEEGATFYFALPATKMEPQKEPDE